LFVWSVPTLCLLFLPLLCVLAQRHQQVLGFASYFSFFFPFFFDTFCIAHGCWSGDATTGKYPKTLDVTCWSGDATRENASARRLDARPAFSSALRSPSFGVSGVGRGGSPWDFFLLLFVWSVLALCLLFLPLLGVLA
jgi:hypothetical protein